MGFFDKFLAFAAPASFHSLQQYGDNEVLKQDYGKIAKDANYQPDITAYSDPDRARASLAQFQSETQAKQAAPILDNFATKYADIAGPDKRFFLYPEELKKAGLDIPSNNPNPAVRQGLQAFGKQAQFEDNLSQMYANPSDVNSLARVAADPLAQANHNVIGTLQVSQDKAIDQQRKQQKEDFTEQQRLEKAAQQAEFERIAAGIGGRYQAAQPQQFNEGADGQLQQVPITAPQGKQPNVWNGFNYVDGKGDVTPRQIMPYDEARKNLLQAAGDYPMADTKEALNALEKQYGKEYTDANYKPSAVNWNGTATTDKNQLQLAAESGDPLAQRIIAAQDSREIALNKAKAEDRRTILVNNPLPAKVEVNALTPEEQTALTTAIAERRLDPYKVNSKNQKLLASAAMSHPGVDLNTIAAELGLARNTQIQIKAATAEMLPGLVQKTVEAGKALNYSDVKFVGAVEKWKQGQLNDPKLTKYMTLRNDQLLTIGGVMRSNGMTDMAQKLEEEAMHPTLSPKALDSWMEGQLESIDPRLNFYRKATKGNTAIPRANYTPKASTGYGTGGGNSLQAAAAAELARRRGGK